MLRQFIRDAQELTTLITRKPSTGREMLRIAVVNDSYAVLALSRVRDLARQYRIPALSNALRKVQTVLHGIEIGKNVTLGDGVWFIHPLGVVLGGDARIGNRVRFFGNNTVGTAKENGYPTIEDDVWIGAGARILGPITIGARSVIGANAVVLTNVPPDSVAVGVPARIISKRESEGVEAERFLVG